MDNSLSEAPNQPADRCLEKCNQSVSKKVPFRVVRRIAMEERATSAAPPSPVHMIPPSEKQMARAFMTGRTPVPQSHAPIKVESTVSTAAPGSTKRAPYRSVRRSSKEASELPRQPARRFSEELAQAPRQYIRRLSEEALKVPGEVMRRFSDELSEAPRKYIRRLSEEVVEAVSVSETGMMRLFDKMPNWMFPFQCSSIEGFVALNFWYSIILTVGTPLNRLLKGQWQTCNAVPRLINLVSRLVFGCDANLEDVALYYPVEGSTSSSVPGSGATSPPPESIKGLDRGFAIHALCGLLWLSTATLQMTFFRRYDAGRQHRRFGYVTMMAFMLHMAAAAHNLWLDVVVHKPVIKVALASVVVISSVYMAQGMFHALRRGQDWRSKHEDNMIRCFLYSIEGSGAIRVVGALLHYAGHGPTHCQNRAGGLATECVRGYMVRLMAVRCWTMFVMGGYARMVGRRDFISVYLRETALLLVAFVCMLLAYVAEDAFGLDLSSFASKLNTERSALGNLSALCTGVVYAAIIAGYLLAPFTSHQMQMAAEFERMWRASFRARQPSFRHSFVNKRDSWRELFSKTSAPAARNKDWRTTWKTESCLQRAGRAPPAPPQTGSRPQLRAPPPLQRVESAPLRTMEKED